MHIKVENAAKILNADIVVDGLTVIAGYNNMGKSTILKTAYIVFNTFRNAYHKVRLVRMRSLESYIRRLEVYFDINGYDHLPRELLITLTNKVNNCLDVFMNNQRDSYSLLKKIFLESLEECRDFYDLEIDMENFFSDDFIRPIYEKIMEISSRNVEQDLKYIAEMYIRNVFQGQINSLHVQRDTVVKIDSDSEQYFMVIKENKVADMEYTVNAEADVFYLPAYNLLDMTERPAFISGMYSPEYDIRTALTSQKKVPTLEEYQEMEDNTKLIKDILQEVLHGKLEESSSGSIFFNDKALNSSISIGNVASGMKNFLVIQALIEKGKLKRNGILMIDEPETNLHPEWHLKFAEILVLLYKYMGIRSIVNSHSPYFIRAIEVKMADEQMKDKGHYYVMEEADQNLFKVQDVTEHTDKIYELLYRPLEYL